MFGLIEYIDCFLFQFLKNTGYSQSSKTENQIVDLEK